LVAIAAFFHVVLAAAYAAEFLAALLRAGNALFGNSFIW
jgi:hypothetical protein